VNLALAKGTIAVKLSEIMVLTLSFDLDTLMIIEQQLPLINQLSYDRGSF
jgi:hypothetical protein